jgi:hypothetical protein
MASLQRPTWPQVWPKEYYFMLVNGQARSQTSVIMKNLPGKLKLVVLTAIGVVVMLVIQACAPFILNVDHGIFALTIKCPQQIKGVAAFEEALNTLSKSAIYDIHLVRDDGTSKDYRRGSRLTIKTDRVITTELAKSLSTDEFTAIGSSITYHVYSPNATDISIVLNQIKKSRPSLPLRF